MRRCASLMLFALLLSPKLPAVGCEPVPTKVYIVDASIRDEAPERSMKKGTPVILAAPRVLVRENEKADVLVGGEVIVGSEKLGHGISLTVKVQSADDGNVRLTGVFEVSAVGTPSADLAVRESTAIHFAKTVTCGQKIRVCMSESAKGKRWCELLVQEQDD